MRRRAWVAALVLLLVAGAVYARLLAGGPLGPVPGGWLRGEVVAQPVSDWSFARLARPLRVESRARLLPHSTDPWFIVHEGRLHLLLTGLLHGGLLERLDEDPRIRVEVDGKIYEQVAVRVEDPAEISRLVRPGLRKLFAIETVGEIRRTSAAGAGNLAVFRVENPRVAGAAP
ncbi:MAG TPA: hypothetical protein VFG80_06760 [Myxococcota bacterium]|nr:hypothetical protein [Myxococcota bacterium]